MPTDLRYWGHKNTTEKKPLDFTSNNTECYNEQFSLDELSEFPRNAHDTAVGPARAAFYKSS